LDFKKVEFIKSAPSAKDAPSDKKKEILLVGRSNVGKSSLINSLTNRKSLAFVSSKPGHTKLLNYYLIDDSIYLVDAPGYGYQANKTETFFDFGELMEGYFSSDRNKALIILLLDARREPNDEDKDIINFLSEENIPFLIVLTKSDKATQKEVYATRKAILNLNLVNEDNLFATSVNKNKGIDQLKKRINSLI